MATTISRRLARRVRRAALVAAGTIEQAVVGARDPLRPPLHLRAEYYRTWRPEAFTRACSGAAAELKSRGLRPEHRLLDVGSGLGNLALGLVDHLHGGYDGVEIHPEAVAWCQRAITTRHPGFRFHRADLRSVAYNPGGRFEPESYTFPFPDRTFDAVFLGSVFTHLLPDAVERYLSEIARVLAPRGQCVASYFLLHDDNRGSVSEGRGFMTFPVERPDCRLHDAARPEAAVALDEAFVRRVHDQVGLDMVDVRRGGWWRGVADDQDMVTAVRR